jgi:hypothetical protein
MLILNMGKISKTLALLLTLTVLMSCLTLLTIKPSKAQVGVTNPSVNDTLANSWIGKAPMHQARGGLGVVSVNNTIYAIGGSTSNGRYTPDLLGGFVGTNEMYNVTADTWSYKSPMPTSRDYFAIAFIGDTIYCIGGHIGNRMKDVCFTEIISSGVNEAYNITADKWETKAPMPINGTNLQATVIGAKVLVTGQGLGYLYDPNADSWTNSSALQPQYSLVGYNPPFIAVKVGNRTIQTDVCNGSPILTSGINASRRIYVMGVLCGVPPIRANKVYDQETDSWLQGTPMPTLCMDFGLASVYDKIYAIGGFKVTDSNGNVAPTNANEQYLPIGYGSPDKSFTTPSPSPTVPELSWLAIIPLMVSILSIAVILRIRKNR